MSYLSVQPQVPAQPKSIKLPSIHSLLLDLPTVIQSTNALPTYHNSNPSNYSSSSHLNVSPVGSPPRVNNSSFNQLVNAATSETRNRSLSDPLRPKLESLSPISSTPITTTPITSTTSPTPSTVDVANEHKQENKKWKPRKKRQCPECKLYFSNLATHKSTHLKPTSRPHICQYCNRGFARPNDLFRHVKCHWKEIGSDKGQFKCPFKHHSPGDYCCHSSGIFSRCDTFKNHLKAIHFQYPNGTKKDQRNKVPGECRMCHAQFKNVDDWLLNHIETNECQYGEYNKN
ncbi:hypothetical protein HYPBUDRAFT_151894 [Hyphopichia burtonii NRRL Y-1933]|uniref:C2H2-type domain-containing protein n=1 Tax=Hyphopichia burtonii NRRL Y-1933 TaxID=984485 RepID=A0A1E4RMB1_9ASCO|nr:hypothetical protein HYPBUDRAFT_151894 [Hyphopichia burtonii NRRL Y-1933]ODV68404.1 hypothetical protein HYPBUDRAFT_151894 [Hyphopichia burtonii NRRL Y-1933]